VIIFRASSQPSLVTASASSMCHGARVDEQRNSSSRVQRHLTGRLAFSASRAVIVSVAVVDLAAEAAADGAADELQLVERPLEVAATTPIEKYIACVHE
jgi:hypothetical protein